MTEKPQKIANDVVVSLDYVLSVDDEIVDTTEGTTPILYLHGHGEILPALEQAMEGAAIGEEREVHIPASEGYGEYDPAMQAEIERGQFPANFVFTLGGQLRIQDTNGNNTSATIRAIGAQNITLDFNHPLAGKDLLFNTTVVDLRAATQEEIDRGQVQ